MKKFLLCFFLCSSSIITAQERFSIAGSLDDLKLLNNPESVVFSVDKSPIPGHPKALNVIYDFHCLADIPLSKLKNVMTDRDRFVEFVPRLIDYSWEKKVLDDGTEIIIEDELVGLNVLGIKSAYHYSLNTREIEDPGDGIFKLKWTLNSSFDGEIGSINGSWYFTEVFINGNKYTYMRYYNDCLFLSPPGYTKFILDTFAHRDMKKLLMSFIKQSKNIK